jgi:DNA-binding NarL/FixJ family response regulator
MQKINILIADDHALIRQAWRYMLSAHPRFNVVGEVASGEEAVAAAQVLHPDIVMLDIHLGGMDGIETTRLIRTYSPHSRVIGVSLHNQSFFVRGMMKSGASGYVTKNSTSEEMFEAILTVSEGKTFICSEIKSVLSNQMICDDQPAGLELLSRREMQIISLIKKGMTSKSMATPLGISPKTVEVHRYKIMKKLKMKNVASLVDFINKSPLAFESEQFAPPVALCA